MFRDRTDAGQQLAVALAECADCPGGLVLAIPRGGVIVGLELSLALRLPLDVLITRKIGAPGNPELAIAAYSETGFLYPNQEILALYPAWKKHVEQEKPKQEQEIARRRELYRGGKPLPFLEGKTVLLVDDGVATGATYLASVQALKAARVAFVVAALPVAPSETASKIAAHVDRCLVLERPDPFEAVGLHYQHFPQVEDWEVVRALQRSRLALAQSPRRDA